MKNQISLAGGLKRNVFRQELMKLSTGFVLMNILSAGSAINSLEGWGISGFPALWGVALIIAAEI